MPHWWIKASIQRVISWLPNPAAWNELFQKHVSRSLVLTPAKLGDKLAEGQKFADLFRRHYPGNNSGFTALELGTGWHPIIPLALYLCGARCIWTFDIDPHLSRKRLTELLDQLLGLDDQSQLLRHLPGAIPERVQQLRTWRGQATHEAPETWLKRVQIHAAVRDARHTGLPAGRVDFVFSSGVLEYIPVPMLQELLQEFRRISAAGAFMVHRLNLVDQFAYFDRRLSPFNHLRYTEGQWRWRSSPLIWQNRIRLSDYRRLFQEAGYTITGETNTSGTPAELDRVPLAPEFQKYSAADLLVLHSIITARRADSIPAPGQV